MEWLRSAVQGLRATPVLLGVTLSACLPTQNIPFGTNLGTIKKLGATFEAPPNNVEPPPSSSLPDGNVQLEAGFTYWLAAGDQVSTSWSEYLDTWPCTNTPPHNLCDATYRTAVPSANCDTLALSLPSSCNGSGGCPRVWVFQCQNLDCSNKMVFPPSPKSVAEGCSPSFISFIPTQDAAFELWASERIDVVQNMPSDGLGDKIGPTLSVAVVQPGMPRVVVKRRPLTQVCGPSTPSFPQSGPCSTNPTDDQSESHWVIDMTKFRPSEVFSTSLRVKEARVYTADENDTMASQAAFCWVQGRQPMTRVDSDCDASLGAQMADCKATPAADLTPASPGWTVAFSDAPRPQPDGSTLPSRCPNNRNRGSVWLEFTLATRR